MRVTLCHHNVHEWRNYKDKQHSRNTKTTAVEMNKSKIRAIIIKAKGLPYLLVLIWKCKSNDSEQLRKNDLQLLVETGSS